MKIPSLASLWLQTTKVFFRFPLQVIITILATSVWWYLIDNDGYINPLQINLLKFLFVSNLALTLLLASDLYAEVSNFNVAKKWIFRFIALAICTGLYFALNPSQNEADVYRLLILSFAFHLLVAFSPFIGNRNLNGFWHYNKTLFLRFLTSILYAGVLYAGLSIAILAIDGLFNVTIDYRVYLKLLAVVSICFTTIFFLAGLPDDINSLNQDETYPKGLKIFTQYVLIPLLTIYLAILLVYEVKIAIEWQLPKGLVSTLILGYAVFGILSLLLIYPIKNQEGNGWMKLFSKFFYVMMLPLLVLLILAIVKRVGSYGITEPRYYLIILALWLSAITFYFLFSKNQNIKIIPISLCIMALLTLYGPQSAFSVSKISQISRLKKIFELKLKTSEDEKDQSSIIKYLVKNHDLKSLQSFTKVNLTTIENKIDSKTKNSYDIQYIKTDTAFAILRVREFDFSSTSVQINASKINKEVIVNSDFDFCILLKNDIEINSFVDNTKIKIIRSIENDKKNLGSEYRTNIILTFDGNETINFYLKKSFVQILEQCKNGKFKQVNNTTHYTIPTHELQFVNNSKKYQIKLVINSLDANYQNSLSNLSWLEFDGYLLFRKL